MAGGGAPTAGRRRRRAGPGLEGGGGCRGGSGSGAAAPAPFAQLVRRCHHHMGNELYISSSDGNSLVHLQFLSHNKILCGRSRRGTHASEGGSSAELNAGSISAPSEAHKVFC